MRVGAFSLFILLLLSTHCLAKNLTVVTEMIFPYQVIKEDGTLGGYSTNIMKLLFELTGDNANIQVLPWARAYKTAQHVPNTLIYSISRNKLREQSFIWGGCLMKAKLFVWGIKGLREQPIQSFEELKNYKISLLQNSHPQQYFKELNFKYVYPVSNQDQSIGMLFLNRVDLILGTKEDIITRTKQMNFDSEKLVKLMEIEELNQNLYFAFSLGTDPKVITKYQQAYKTLQPEIKLMETTGQCDEN